MAVYQTAPNFLDVYDMKRDTGFYTSHVVHYRSISVLLFEAQPKTIAVPETQVLMPLRIK